MSNSQISQKYRPSTVKDILLYFRKKYSTKKVIFHYDLETDLKMTRSGSRSKLLSKLINDGLIQETFSQNSHRKRVKGYILTSAGLEVAKGILKEILRENEYYLVERD